MDQEPINNGRRLVSKGSQRLHQFKPMLTAFVQYPELSVAAYNKNPQMLNEPDGVVAVWNLHLLERPEFVFHSQVCPLRLKADSSLVLILE